MNEPCQPQPVAGLLHLAFVVAVGIAVLQVLFSSGPDQVVGIVMLGLALAAVLLYAWIQRYGNEMDRAAFPPPRQLIKNTRDDLRSAWRWLGVVWTNLGGQ